MLGYGHEALLITPEQLGTTEDRLPYPHHFEDAEAAHKRIHLMTQDYKVVVVLGANYAHVVEALLDDMVIRRFQVNSFGSPIALLEYVRGLIQP